MNDFALELGMTDSHFVNPDGWDDPQHYSTAADMVKLAEYALTVPEICETMTTAY
jgi:D-alanyl-D-alanine carboxypeptidase (penicillin-binding protein 5/6)